MWEQIRAGSRSEQASALILASWRKNTEAAYSCSWKRWQQWCSLHGFESVCASLSVIIEFLSSEFTEGKQYRTLNSYCSAISMTHQPIDGVLVGKHPLICRLLKGIYNSRPPQPKFSTTWDVGKILDYIRSLGPTGLLNLRQLTHKLAMLLALVYTSRASELHALDKDIFPGRMMVSVLHWWNIPRLQVLTNVRASFFLP